MSERMVTLIWNNVVYVVPGDYYEARRMLGVPDGVITPWASFSQGIEWTKRFIT